VIFISDLFPTVSEINGITENAVVPNFANFQKLHPFPGMLTRPQVARPHYSRPRHVSSTPRTGQGHSWTRPIISA